MKNLVIVALLIAIGFNANAQNFKRNNVKTQHQNIDEKMSPEERAEKQSTKMKEELGLNKKQFKKVKEINLNASNEIQTIRNSRMPQAEKQNQIEVINRKRDSQFKEVLNQEQFGKYYDNVEKLRAKKQVKSQTKTVNIKGKVNLRDKANNNAHTRGGNHHAGHNKQERFEKMAQELNLSQQQAEQIKEIHKRSRANIQALKQNANNGEIPHERIKALKDAERAQVKQILTPEQARRFDEMHTNRMEMKHNPQMRAKHATDKMAQELNLTPTQAKQVMQINERAAQAKSQLKQSGIEKNELNKQRFKNIEVQREKELSTVLSAQQMQQYKKLKAERKTNHKGTKANGVKQMPRPH